MTCEPPTAVSKSRWGSSRTKGSKQPFRRLVAPLRAQRSTATAQQADSRSHTVLQTAGIDVLRPGRGAPSADDACCSATPLHGSGLSSGAPVAAATSAGVMRAHFGARYTWPRRCCAGCCTAVADHLLLETKGCATVGRGFVMSSDSTEAWDTQEWAVIELQHHPCRLFGPYPLQSRRGIKKTQC